MIERSKELEQTALRMAARLDGVRVAELSVSAGCDKSRSLKVLNRLVSRGELFKVSHPTGVGPDRLAWRFFCSSAAADGWRSKRLHDVRAAVPGVKQRSGVEPPLMPRSLDRNRPAVFSGPHRGPPKLTVCPPCQVERFAVTTAPRVIDSQQCREWARAV